MKEQFIKNAQAQFLRDTCRDYSSKTRCVGAIGCQYAPTMDSPGCALGRHIPNKQTCILLDLASNSGGSVNADNPMTIDAMGPLRVLSGRGFLTDMQALHDATSYWTATGLSESGRQEAMKICITHGLDASQVFPPAE
jgi:hypothetical protein